jgi:hypothetical protein
MHSGGDFGGAFAPHFVRPPLRARAAARRVCGTDVPGAQLRAGEPDLAGDFASPSPLPGSPLYVRSCASCK